MQIACSFNTTLIDSLIFLNRRSCSLQFWTTCPCCASNRRSQVSAYSLTIHIFKQVLFHFFMVLNLSTRLPLHRQFCYIFHHTLSSLWNSFLICNFTEFFSLGSKDLLTLSVYQVRVDSSLNFLLVNLLLTPLFYQITASLFQSQLSGWLAKGL